MASAPSATAPAGRALTTASQPQWLGLSTESWVKIAILGPLFVAVYWLVLRWLWDKTNPIYGEANWGHAICIPIVGLYYLYINRDELLRQPVEPLLLGKFTSPWRLRPALGMIAIGTAAWLLGSDPSGFISAGGAALGVFGLLVLLLDWGLGSLLFGLALFAYGIYPGQNQFVQGCAMILTLFGVVLMLAGWKVMKYAWFPIFYLVCGIPWPQLVYSYIASPLQTLAAKAAVVTLRFTGVNAYRTGTKINMGGITEELRTLNVAEACAGLRSLMTFITVGVAVAFLSARPLWQKIVISASAVPIAVFCNMMRVAGQGLLDHYVSRQLSESFAHQFVGLVMLVPAFFLILLVGWLLDHLFVEEVDEKVDPRRAGAMSPAAAAALVVDIPRRPQVAPVPAARTPHLAPHAVPPKATAPARPATVMPPRPGVVPPRPGIVPPRPAGAVPPRPLTPPPPIQPKPQTPKEGQ
jgi:exosortase